MAANLSSGKFSPWLVGTTFSLMSVLFFQRFTVISRFCCAFFFCASFPITQKPSDHQRVLISEAGLVSVNSKMRTFICLAGSLFLSGLLFNSICETHVGLGQVCSKQGICFTNSHQHLKLHCLPPRLAVVNESKGWTDLDEWPSFRTGLGVILGLHGEVMWRSQWWHYCCTNWRETLSLWIPLGMSFSIAPDLPKIIRPKSMEIITSLRMISLHCCGCHCLIFFLFCYPTG